MLVIKSTACTSWLKEEEKILLTIASFHLASETQRETGKGGDSTFVSRGLVDRVISSPFSTGDNHEEQLEYLDLQFRFTVVGDIMVLLVLVFNSG